MLTSFVFIIFTVTLIGCALKKVQPVKVLIFILGLSSILTAQNIVIVNGQFNEAYDMETVTDISIGNNCDIPNFTNLYYNGDMELKGDMYINDCILTVYGEFEKNGFEVFYSCDKSELIIDNTTLTIAQPLEESFLVYPNPTKGIFYVKTRKKYSVRVYDSRGRHLISLPDLREFPTGIYLAVITIDNRTVTKRIVKV